MQVYFFKKCMMFGEEKDNFTLNKAGICNCMSLELLFMTRILTHSAHPKVHSNMKRGGSQKFKSLTEVAKKKEDLAIQDRYLVFQKQRQFLVEKFNKAPPVPWVYKIVPYKYCPFSIAIAK